ncbi:chemotaxis protein CheW [Acanthopleuribacter pedis]|uniref:Purine-binding chemotaxis protein CheW n=1 Tax=Acanthopleuribacter pedis TaxID=442870 RepID=A0A8J7PZN7_9BACT|nr:chemotaxis protein CheW [Acanthopleuribacter pedis]MBO1317692.1 purine-binding chemotaxis protein CheW [Acanthopleuribacter pedis]
MSTNFREPGAEGVEERLKELVIFKVAGLLCGLEALNVREILRSQKVTPVYHAPEYVLGVVNLRGDIVTIIDLQNKLGLDPDDSSQGRRNVIIVEYYGENVGLAVHQIQDILQANVDQFEAPPSNLTALLGDYLSMVYKMTGKLVSVLNIERLLDIEPQ